MRDVWSLPAIGKWEKTFGKHPTQKPISLLVRVILASTREMEWVLDPFAGSCTTGIAARLLHRRFFGIDQSEDFLALGKKRFNESETLAFRAKASRRVADLQNLPQTHYVCDSEVDGYEATPFLN